MKKLLLGLVLSIGALGLSNTANAGEQAATEELPAALVALGGQQQVLTTQEAKEVRGEGLLGLGLKSRVSIGVGASVNLGGHKRHGYGHGHGYGYGHRRSSGISMNARVRVWANVGLGLGI